MFCPNCGRDNANELKFCASCGTDLEAVSQALTGREADVFTKLDNGLDQFIGRYAEHVFSQPRPGSGEHGVVRSWRLLGQAFVTTLVDLFMFSIMWNILPLRFLLLLITSPIRILTERHRQALVEGETSAGYSPPQLGRKTLEHLPPKSAPSVTEGTTSNLLSRQKTAARRSAETDQLEED